MLALSSLTSAHILKQVLRAGIDLRDINERSKCLSEKPAADWSFVLTFATFGGGRGVELQYQNQELQLLLVEKRLS